MDAVRQLRRSQCRRNRRSSLLLIGSGYLAFVLLFLLHGWLRYSALRYSAFYNLPQQIIRLTERDARNEAASVGYMERLFAQQSASIPPLQTSHESAVNICTVILTVPREKRYLFQTIASILLSATDQPVNQTVSGPVIPINIFYTHSAPHPDFEALAKAKVLKLRTLDRKLIQTNSNDYNWVKAETVDYATALQWCYDEYLTGLKNGDVRSHLTLILEDDVVTTRYVIKKLIAGVQPLLDRHDWLLVRLYRSAFMDGWEKEDWLIIVGFGVAGGIIGAAGALALDRVICRSDAVSAPFLYYPLFLVMILSGGITVCVIMMLNKQNLFFYRTGDGLHLDHGSTGSPALVYSTEHLARLVEFVLSPERREGLAVDLAINDFMDATGLLQFHLVPDLFDHRGVISSSPGVTGLASPYMKNLVSSSFVDEVNLQLAG